MSLVQLQPMVTRARSLTAGCLRFVRPRVFHAQSADSCTVRQTHVQHDDSRHVELLTARCNVLHVRRVLSTAVVSRSARDIAGY